MDGYPGHRSPREVAVPLNNERRRMSRVVHDDRGNASVVWHDAPDDYERPVFEIESSTGTHRRLDVLGGNGLSLESTNSGDPYASRGPVERKRSGATTRTDLRKLSEWIKMKRELEERKLRAANETDDED